MLWGRFGPLWRLSCLLGRKVDGDANERHTRGHLSAGSPAKVAFLRDVALLSLCEGTTTSLRRGGQRWEGMWTAEIIAHRKISLLPVREEESHQRKEAASGAKCRIVIVLAGIPLPWFYMNFYLLHLKKRETNPVISKTNKRFFNFFKVVLFFVF